MSYPAQAIVRNAHITLQDLKGIRWPASELVGYLNDGQRELIIYRPDATAATASFVPARGARQVLPPAAAALMDVQRNTLGSKKAIRKVPMAYLDAIAPGWQGMAEATEFEHFMHDLREPRVFYLYPPAKAAGGSVELVTSNYPEDIPAPGGATADTVTGDIGVADCWANALLSYALFRAYAKDAEFSSNTALATAHLAAFTAATGTQIKSATAVAPTPTK